MKKFLLISDIHASERDPYSSDAPSYFSSHYSSDNINIDLLDSLYSVLESERQIPDYILCPGDITDRSNPNAFQYAWNKLHLFANKYGVPLIATVGNHDLDSRYKENTFDARGYVMSMKPVLPVEERERFLEFWAENFTVIKANDCNVVVLNTAAYHGGGGDDYRKELERGRISDVTLKLIDESIKKLPPAKNNILLCHHHPIKAHDADTELEGYTRGGEKLIRLLDEANEPWIVVHGHKHQPDLLYGPGGANSPIVLGCGSFSAQINADAQNKSPNQVHMLVTDPAGAEAVGMSSAGYVLSWTWEPGGQWRRASNGQRGLPYFSGFGYRGDISKLVNKVDNYLSDNNIIHVDWKVIVENILELDRLLPKDFSTFRQKLNFKGINILNNDDGSPAQVGRSE